MSTCTKWVDKGVITCKNWGTKVDYECTSWADEGSSQCSSWKDEGTQKCSSWKDEGTQKCADWTEKHCHWYSPWNCIAGWFCTAFYWVANWVCQGWYWVANWVCQAWYWVAKWVCKAFAWVVKAVCAVWGWVAKLVCVAWDTLRCAMLALARWLRGLFGGRQRAPEQKIEHVFVLMLENRSFDHMLGFSGIKGGVDPFGQPTSFNDGWSTSLSNVNPADGSDVPVSSPADFFFKGIDEDPGHEFEQTVVALCWRDEAHGGPTNPKYDPDIGYPPIHNSGFVKNYADGDPEHPAKDPTRIMKCFAPEQLPVINALAREFAVCDQWFSSLPGPTWPNRFFLVAASSGGLDGSPSSLDVVTSTGIEGYRFANGTIFDLMDQYCMPWRIFEGDEFPVSFAISGMNLNALQGRFTDFEDFRSELSKDSFKEKFVFIEPKYGAHGFDILGPGDFACGNSMHPLDDVTRGERLIKNVYEAIRNSPHWEKSLLIVTFDEHGGFYDHVAPPPAVPPGDLITKGYSQFGFEFDQLGVRVPALVISPFVERGVIDHSVYDHTSVLATVERLFGLPNLTRRDQEADDVLKLLTRAEPRTDAPTTLPSPATPETPLPCEEDDDEDTLMLKRSELRIARRRGHYRDVPVRELPLTRSQVGFMQVALLKVLQTAEHPERQAWIDDYKRVQTGIDAAIFMAEARLKLRHGIDVKKAEIEGERAMKATTRPRKRRDR